MSNVRFVYPFDTPPAAEFPQHLLGGKGAGLSQMTQLGIQVPHGFTITTEMCSHYYESREHIAESVRQEVLSAIVRLERRMNKRFGDLQDPLLVSVRSGARVSMPGMMDTILNLGLNDQTVEGLAQVSGNAFFAWDSYQRFIQMYAHVVLGIKLSADSVLYNAEGFSDFGSEVYQNGHLDETTVSNEPDQVKVIAERVEDMKDEVLQVTGRPFPQDVMEQLWGGIEAVLKSWHSERAVAYRRHHRYPDDWGTAVNVQAMVFGNMGPTSATGVAFTRDPNTGKNTLFGEYLPNAQGEDIVSGSRTPLPLSGSDDSLEQQMPKVYQELKQLAVRLEAHYKDMQDIEFTIERGQLWMLQARSGKRSTQAAVKIATDMVEEGVLSCEQALLRVDPASIESLLHPTVDPQTAPVPWVQGLPASPGAAVGRIVFSSQEAALAGDTAKEMVLVRVETSPEDIAGMIATGGILTSCGGMTSHAAVVARGMGKPCVAGCGELHVDHEKQEVRGPDGVCLKAGDVITIDGASGHVFRGEVPTCAPQLGERFEALGRMADRVRRMRVRANADTPHDAQLACRFGAEGIGLCRTEHMFFAKERIDVVREMILSETVQERESALQRILPMQRSDFTEILRVMGERPVTIRLLDPPLHEFLPAKSDLQAIEELAKSLRRPLEEVQQRVQRLEEANPMLGHRGCRLALTYPEIYRMQAQAIGEATAILLKEEVSITPPEIMVPLVGSQAELAIVRQLVKEVLEEVSEREGVSVLCDVGTMIELPRAAVAAGAIAQEADFFSFGTNDLTQTVLGMGRDDASKFLQDYISHGVYEVDPFVSLDQTGVGQMVEMAARLGRKAQTKLKLGICGEHGGDPKSIEFFEKVGLDYISCSPYRVPVARLAAAQATIRWAKDKGA